MQSLAISNYIFEKQLNDSPQENSDNASDTSKKNSDKLSQDSFAQLVAQLGELSTVAKFAIKKNVKVRLKCDFQNSYLFIYFSTV